jgi:mRNA degradation ribonuclease J1/J2
MQTMESAEMRHMTDSTLIRNRLHDVLQRYLNKEAGRRPMVLPVVVEV